jgi:hypothetical protein
MVEPYGMDRRRFARLVGAGAALGFLERLGLPLARADEAAPSPLFRFVQWNDTHVDATRPSAYRLANEKAAYLADWVNAAQRSSPYDFVVGIGDLIHGGDLADLAEDVGVLKRLVAGLAAPLRPVVGNHENAQREGDPDYEKPFREAFGLDQTNTTFRHKGFLFVMLNNSGAPVSNRQPVGRRRNAWFRHVLEGSPGVPKIVCCHIPLVPLRDAAVLAKSFGFISHVAGDDELLGLVDAHADSIIAVLSGHLHLTGIVRREGVHHVSVSGTAGYPCDFATYDVFPDRIQARVRSSPKKLLTPDTDIHGKPRHKTDYTDAGHPTHESYVKGNASEREFDIVPSGGRPRFFD